MYWNNLSDFLAMGNHGLYVWGSVAVMALCMTLEPLLLRHSTRQSILRLRQQLRAEQGNEHTNTPATSTLTRRTHRTTS